MTLSPDSLILNRFSPSERSALLQWFNGSKSYRALYHPAFANMVPAMSHRALRQRRLLDRRTKIAFTTMHEFGAQLSDPAVDTLVDIVEQQMQKRSH